MKNSATYYRAAKQYKKTLRRTYFLFKRGRGLIKSLYDDQVTIFQNQDIIAEEYADVQERKIILGKHHMKSSDFYLTQIPDLIKNTFRVFRLAADSFTRNAEKNVRYWEQRVGQFQVRTNSNSFLYHFFIKNSTTKNKDVTREMCAGFYPRTLSHVGRVPCIVKSICDQRDLLTGSPLNCLLRDQWTEAKETFEAVLSIMLSQANKERQTPRGK